jgi:hypothetical protein
VARAHGRLRPLPQPQVRSDLNQEYFQLFAFFNNGDEVNADVPISEEAVATYGKLKAGARLPSQSLETKLAELKKTLVEALPAWEERTRSG